MNRAWSAVRWSVGVSGIVSLLMVMDPGGSRLGDGSVSLSPGRRAHAQGPGTLLRYTVVPERSEARYRVREQLVGLSFPNDAVGTTSAIEGGIALDAHGRVLPDDSRFAVDLRALRSDEARRDNYVRRNTLETERYPTVIFVPTDVRGLRVPLPQTGTASLELVGNLTIRDATRRVTWEATAAFNGPEVSLRATTAFRFVDFGLRIPRVSVVLSVEETIRLEIDLVLLRRSS